MFLAAWVKLKLSQESGPGWDGQSQHRMEGTKAELQPRPRKSAQAKVQTSSGWGNAVLRGIGILFLVFQALWGGLAGEVTLQMSQSEGQGCVGELVLLWGSAQSSWFIGWRNSSH